MKTLTRTLPPQPLPPPPPPPLVTLSLTIYQHTLSLRPVSVSEFQHCFDSDVRQLVSVSGMLLREPGIMQLSHWSQWLFFVVVLFVCCCLFMFTIICFKYSEVFRTVVCCFHSGCSSFCVHTFHKMTRDNVLFKLLGKHLSDSRSLQISPEWQRFCALIFLLLLLLLIFFSMQIQRLFLAQVYQDE